MKRRMLAVLTAMGMMMCISGCGSSDKASESFAESTAVSTTEKVQEEYTKVSDIDQFVELVKKEYTDYGDDICIYAVRCPNYLSADDPCGLMVRVISTNVHRVLDDKVIACNYGTLSAINGDMFSSPVTSTTRFLSDGTFYSAPSVIDLFDEYVGGHENINYYEPVIVYNTFTENVLPQYSLDFSEDDLPVDEDSNVMVSDNYYLGKITDADEFRSALGHALVYWHDKNNHEENGIDGDPEKEDISYKVYIEKVAVDRTPVTNDSEKGCTYKFSAVNQIIVYVDWKCPNSEDTNTIVVYAPQRYKYPLNQSIDSASFPGYSCTYLASFGYNGAEHGDTDEMAWWGTYWDTSEILPAMLAMYKGDVNELKYFEPQMIFEGTVKAGSYHDGDLHPEEWE